MSAGRPEGARPAAGVERSRASATQTAARQGPLVGVRVLEFAGIGPGPFAGMLLADLGADVVRIDRPDPRAAAPDPKALSGRGKRSIALDLKSPEGRDEAARLADAADLLIEGYRPGVMERLGLGPDLLLERNPGLVYGRMTGWGQEGPLAQAAGHDLNYIAISGALAAIGEPGRKPVPPLNLVGDFGGGSLYLIMGLLAALVERQRSGRGQVVDCAMSDGAASLMTMFYARRAQGAWSLERGSNLIDGGAHFYGTYACQDGKYVSIGAIEPQFYADLRRLAGLEDEAYDAQMERSGWPTLRARLEAVFLRRTRAQWCELLEGSDACFAPVLDMSEAPDHPHNRARGTLLDVGGVVQPAPAPRFSRTPGAIQGPAPGAGQHGDEVRAEWLAPRG